MERWTRLVAWTVEEWMGKRGERARIWLGNLGTACVSALARRGRTGDYESPICDRWCGLFARAVAYARQWGRGGSGVAVGGGEGVPRSSCGVHVLFGGEFWFWPFLKLFSLTPRQLGRVAGGVVCCTVQQADILLHKLFLFLH